MLTEIARQKAREANCVIAKNRPRIGGRFTPLPKIEWDCVICGKHVVYQPSMAKLLSQKYCSQICYHKHRTGRSLSKDLRLKISNALKGRLIQPHACKHTSEKIHRWIVEHDTHVLEILASYKQEGLSVIPLIKSSIPDGVIIDFEQHKIFALEVGSHSKLKVEQSFPWADEVIFINFRKEGCKRS